MVAMGFLSCRSESVGLCGRTDATNAIPVAFGERSGPFDAGRVQLEKNYEHAGDFKSRNETQSRHSVKRDG